MILSAIGKTVIMFVALADMTSFDLEVTPRFCTKVQTLMEKRENFVMVIPDYYHASKPLAVLCLDPEAGE